MNKVIAALGFSTALTLSPALAQTAAASLRGDAADSPITERKSQNSYGLFGSYHF